MTSPLCRPILLTCCLALVPIAPLAAQDEQPEPNPTAETIANIAGAEAPTEASDESKSFLARWTESWEGGFALGLNGSGGNTENFNVRTGIDGTRKTDKTSTRFDITYSYGQSDNETSKNYFSTAIRNDWVREGSRWRPFLRGTLEADQFQDWRWRTGGYGGVGYAFINQEEKKLIARVGAGTRYDFTGGTQGLTPEGNIGIDYVAKINDRQKILITTDMYPSFDKITDYRIESRAEWSLLIDTDSNLSLVIGAEDRYDSTPGDGFKRNDIDYFALLSWAY